MSEFARARSAEQRQVRRQTILDTTAAMLAEMPVAAVSLNELSRRVGLAKSNVLRYFESREAVLLELLGEAEQEWSQGLEPALAAVDPATPARARCHQIAEVVAGSLAARPVLCDLVSAQAAVLERNVSPAVAASFKRTTMANLRSAGRHLGKPLPELSEEATTTFAGMTAVAAGAFWSYAHPSAAMLAAYRENADLGALQLDFRTTLTDVLEVLLLGLVAREGAL